MDFSFDEKGERQIVTNKKSKQEKEEKEEERVWDQSHVVFQRSWFDTALGIAGRYTHLSFYSIQTHKLLV